MASKIATLAEVFDVLSRDFAEVSQKLRELDDPSIATFSSKRKRSYWTVEELDRFEKGVIEHGYDLEKLTKAVATKKGKEVEKEITLYKTADVEIKLKADGSTQVDLRDDSAPPPAKKQKVSPAPAQTTQQNKQNGLEDCNARGGL
eukprot:TRINITY_DN1713_c0_g1_i1.p1 TRINITY_DN1713_c0_g1~~TRINITY_DN1713_c0_g1_i1.p1  ORF type:complete len:161 (-),score=69.48 TRINITY_DN1713_c0_g1_i1:26-463(-)